MVEMIRLIPAARWCVTARDLKFLRGRSVARRPNSDDSPGWQGWVWLRRPSAFWMWTFCTKSEVVEFCHFQIVKLTLIDSWRNNQNFHWRVPLLWAKKSQQWSFHCFSLLHLQQCHSGMGQAFTLWTSNISNLWPAMLAKWAGHWCEIQRVWIVIYLLAMLGKKVFFEFLRKVRPFDCRWLKMGTFYFFILGVFGLNQCLWDGICIQKPCEAFLAKRCTECLVLHVGQPSKFGHWWNAANSLRFTICPSVAGFQDRFGGPESSL